MQVETAGEDVPPLVESWNEYGVPEINILIVALDCRRGAHDQDACLLEIIFLNASAASAACLSVPPPMDEAPTSRADYRASRAGVNDRPAGSPDCPSKSRWPR
jgi:hypothetical protein